MALYPTRCLLMPHTDSDHLMLFYNQLGSSNLLGNKTKQKPTFGIQPNSHMWTTDLRGVIDTFCSAEGMS